MLISLYRSKYWSSFREVLMVFVIISLRRKKRKSYAGSDRGGFLLENFTHLSCQCVWYNHEISGTTGWSENGLVTKWFVNYFGLRRKCHYGEHVFSCIHTKVLYVSLFCGKKELANWRWTSRFRRIIALITNNIEMKISIIIYNGYVYIIIQISQILKYPLYNIQLLSFSSSILKRFYLVFYY